MNNWNTDKIIGAGLIAALFLYIVGFFGVIIYNGTITPLDVASNIITGLAGYMGRSLLEKRKDYNNKSTKEDEGDDIDVKSQH